MAKREGRGGGKVQLLIAKQLNFIESDITYGCQLALPHYCCCCCCCCGWYCCWCCCCSLHFATTTTGCSGFQLRRVLYAFYELEMLPTTPSTWRLRLSFPILSSPLQANIVGWLCVRVWPVT